MTKIEEMNEKEIKTFLTKTGYGHLACCQNNRPYIVPIHFIYEGRSIYLFTTDGLKTKIIDQNPDVCLQVEEVRDVKDWQSIIVTGRASRLLKDEDLAFTTNLIEDKNPARIPVLHEVWIGPKERENVSAIYRVSLDFMSGRKTVN